MRNLPEDESDRAELAKMNPEPWMVECLAYNPSYTCWGPGEDFMTTGGKSWGTSQIIGTWSEFGPWDLDDLNEIANFYFAIRRDGRDCDACHASGYNPATYQIGEDFYDFARTGRRWVDKITQDEADALAREGRCKPGTLAVDMNTANGIGHDAINRWILIEARARRLGVWGRCETCSGEGFAFTAPVAHVELTLWFLHPRKGCSRGVRVERIDQAELPTVLSYLRTARDRNATRFGRLPG